MDVLLGDLVVDAAGRLMSLRRDFARPAAPRYYASETSNHQLAERIQAVRLERNVIRLLQRLHLLGEAWWPHELALVLRRVVVCPHQLEFHLNRRACLDIWRAQGDLERRRSIAEAEISRLISAKCPSCREVCFVGYMLCFSSPRYVRLRGRGVRCNAPPESAQVSSMSGTLF